MSREVLLLWTEISKALFSIACANLVTGFGGRGKITPVHPVSLVSLTNSV